MGLIVWTETLAGKEIERRVPGRATAKNMAMTPVKNCLCAQDDLEPVIRRFAEAAGPGTLRFNTELTSFSQKPGGVTGVLTDRTTGAETPFTARYLIAAEGAQSRVRRALGVKMVGEEKVYDSVNILFHADLTQWVEHRPAALYFVEQDDLRATFLTINGRDRWGFLIHGPKQYGWKPQDFTPEFCARTDPQRRRRAGPRRQGARRQPVGSLRHRCRPLSRRRRLPGRRRRARDAADRRLWPQHRGAGRSKPRLEDRRGACAARRTTSLLDSYHDERQPFGQIITRNSLANALSMGRTARQSKVLPRQQFLNEQGLIFGACYQFDGGRAGRHAAGRRSTIPSPNICLPRGPAAARLMSGCGAATNRSRPSTCSARTSCCWPAARAMHGERPRRASARRGRRCAPISIGENGDLSDPDGNWHEAYGVDADGAVLVRPDGYVAWRSRSGASNPAEALRAALDRVFGRVLATA